MYGIDVNTGLPLDHDHSMCGVGASDRGFNMQTYSGKPFYPTSPSVDDVDILDIAHSLSNLCRFNGHCWKFYSVAQHSVIVSRVCAKEYALDGLLHDATEAYIGDIIRPVKYSIPDVERIEARIFDVIAEKFNLHNPIPRDVKRADFIALSTEKRDVMSEPIGTDWGMLAEPLLHRINPLPPEEAKMLFLRRYQELTQ